MSHCGMLAEIRVAYRISNLPVRMNLGALLVRAVFAADMIEEGTFARTNAHVG
jgi:hypothetical protein